MEILENKKKLDVFLSNIREKSHKIGLIPTMGGIHKGHLSLVEKSKNTNCFSLATIFINPTPWQVSHRPPFTLNENRPGR